MAVTYGRRRATNDFDPNSSVTAPEVKNSVSVFNSGDRNPLNDIMSRIANAEAYAGRMENAGNTAQAAGARTKLDQYYQERNKLLFGPTGSPVFNDGGVTATEEQGGPVNASQPDIYSDPVYLRQLQFAQSAFNNARTNALADKERETLYTQDELEGRKTTAEQARRRLAGNYAARGMGGGRSGALSRAEATQNAQELAARTTLRDKISELNRQFVANYGAEGSDWLGTTAGASAQSEAVQAAINARLAGMTTVG
jgi:hypothetical protein